MDHITPRPGSIHFRTVRSARGKPVIGTRPVAEGLTEILSPTGAVRSFVATVR